MVKIIPILIFISASYFLENSMVNIGVTAAAGDDTSFLSLILGSFENQTVNPIADALRPFRHTYETLAQLTKSVVDRMPERVRTEEELKEKKFAILDFIGLAERRGDYTAEEYTLQSDDGYILKLHRISGSPSSPKADGKPVVYLQHCLLCTTDVFVEYGQEQGLALQLADNGYDVWLGNTRGTAYSRAHVKYSPDKNPTEFWKFSHEEPALLDVPKFIDFVLEKTNQTKVTYIGYASGPTLIYILLAGKPEYNDKINLVINFAPAVLFSRPITIQAEGLVTFLPGLAKTAGLLEVLPQSVLLQIFAKIFCSNGSQNLCTISSGLLADPINIGPGVFPETLGYIPSATSYYVLEHYNQLTYANRKLTQFDWQKVGEKCTSLVCSENPGEYDLSLVTAPNVLYYGQKDAFIKTSDVDVLKEQLKNLVYTKEVSGFNHLDFIFNKNVKSEVYDDIVRVMSEYL